MTLYSFILLYMATQFSDLFNETIFSPTLVLGTTAEDQLAVDSLTYSGSLYLIPLVSMSVLFFC